MGALERRIKWIEKLCSDFDTFLKTCKEEVSIRHGYRVRQGDNLALALLTIMTQLAIEVIQTL